MVMVDEVRTIKWILEDDSVAIKMYLNIQRSFVLLPPQQSLD